MTPNWVDSPTVCGNLTWFAQQMIHIDLSSRFENIFNPPCLPSTVAVCFVSVGQIGCRYDGPTSRQTSCVDSIDLRWSNSTLAINIHHSTVQTGQTSLFYFITYQQEDNAVFVMTNMIISPNQTQSTCPEDPSFQDVKCKKDSDCQRLEPVKNGHGKLHRSILSLPRMPNLLN